MRSAKYLNAREYAERLYLSDNRDVQDFALEFIEALDCADQLAAAEAKAEEIIPDMLKRLRPVQEYDL